MTAAVLVAAVAGVTAPASAAKAPAGGPVRVEVLSRSQQAVASSSRVRVRVSSRRRGIVRLGGRVVTFPGGKRRVVRLTRRRVLKVRRGTPGTVSLRLLIRGRREIRRAHRTCGGSRIQVFGLYDARRRARDVGKGKTVRYRAQGR